VIGPIILVGSIAFLCLKRDVPRANLQFWTSAVLFSPAPLIIGLWIVTNGQTKPPLGDIGLGLMVLSSIWVFSTCITSFILGMFCFRTQRLALLWMIPEALLILGLGFFIFKAFT
jgi:hypothetical protein